MTYEYVCTACKHEWEASQSISAPALTECPECHAATAKRQVSGGTGFVLKGGGWYSDLYSSAKPKPAPTESSTSTPSESKGETKSESTPASTKSDTSTASAT